MTLNFRLFLAFLIALALTILPLPELIVGMRPPWVLMLLLFVQYHLPDHFSIGLLIILGLTLDALLSTIIGEHTFALAVVCWLASSKVRRFRFFSIGQQIGLVAVFCLLYQTIIFTIDAYLGFYVNFIDVIGSTLISILLWPWIRLLSEDTLLPRFRAKRQ